MAAGSIPNPNRVIIEYGNWGAVGSIAAGGTLTVTKEIPAKAGYTGYLMDLHMGDAAGIGSYAKIVMGYTINGNEVEIGFTNNHTGSLNPTPRYSILYIAN